MNLATLIAKLPLFFGRARAVEILRAAGFSEYKIREMLKVCPCVQILTCKRRRYRKDVFLATFELTGPGDSKA